MTWWYQLQNHVRLDRTEDILVIDGDKEAHPYLHKPDGTKREVWAYISIGEAEDYRWYWNTLPKQIVEQENPDWEGNYAVRFWDERWQSIIRQCIENIVERGFTGLYLDKCDVIWDLPDSPINGNEKTRMRAMVDFVDWLGGEFPNLKFCLQNAEELLQFEEMHEILDAVAVEDLLVADTAERLEWLDLWHGTRLGVEYTDDKAVRVRLQQLGFEPLLRNRELD